MIHPRTLRSLEFDAITDALAACCASGSGKERAQALKPFKTQQHAEEAFRFYEETCSWLERSRFAIVAWPDIRPILSAVNKKRGPGELPASFALELDALWALREMLRMAQKAIASISESGEAHLWPLLLATAEEEKLPGELCAALERCISDDGLLRDESSPELFRLRSELRSLHQSCLRRVRDYAEQYNMLPLLQDEFMTLASDRYVLPLKANFKGRMQGIIHDWSQTGETCYFEPYFLIEVNNRLQELKHEEREEERRILAYLTTLLDAGLEGVEAAEKLLARLDLMQATRKLSAELNASCITFTTPEEGIELLEARHPLLTLSRRDEKNATPVRPLDIVLRPGERALILTGGNAGGKTVCLKTLGLLAAMAMSGLPIPARRGSHLPWLERIDAFIGDEQSLAANVSTFSAQIDHLAKAFRHLDERGLALLDEFGAGTDPAEGAALAQAVHDELLERNCFILSATHFPALKSYALTKKGARAASMLFDPQTSRPLFRLAYDQVGSSQALAVAAEHGLPESILERARHYLLQDGGDTSGLLERLNDLALQREAEIAHLKQQEAKAASILAEKREKLDRERERLAEDIKAKSALLMSAWKEGKTGAKQTMKDLSGLRAELGLDAKRPESILPESTDFSSGQRVFHAGFNKRGVITDLDKRRQKARIDLNGVGIWADFKDLRVAGSDERAEAGISVRAPKGGPVFSLDVRGQRAAEALAEVERFLDKALLGGSSEVEIIHGRGTGALRREIHAFLRAFPAVESVALAPEDRGGDGMTVVTLK